MFPGRQTRLDDQNYDERKYIIIGSLYADKQGAVQRICVVMDGLFEYGLAYRDSFQ